MPIINKVSDYTILDYVQNQTDSFFKTAFNEVDSVIFAQFTYLDFSRFAGTIEQNQVWTPISSLYKSEEFSHLLDLTLYPVNNKKLLCELCASPRYRDVLINFYENKIDPQAQEQFCGVSFKLPTGEIVIGFRGTDSTVIGWKEDFNMLYISPVPSQTSAVNYLEAVAEKEQGDFYVLGHSKGGNLAAYSSMFAKPEVQCRIINVFDLDGPGFQPPVRENLEQEQIRDKIIKISPEGSFVSVILDSPLPSKAIKSTKIGILQHETFTWLISGNEFVESEKVSSRVKYVDKTLDELLTKLSKEQRQLVIDTIFSVISTTNAERLSDVIPLIIKEKETILKAIKEIDEDTYVFVRQVFFDFLISYFVPISGKKDEKKHEKKEKEPDKKATARIEKTLRNIFDGKSEEKEELV